MGANYSSESNENTVVDKKTNLEKLIDNQDKLEDSLVSLEITELKEKNNENESKENQSKENNIVGGKMKKERFRKYDVFRMINNLEKDFIKENNLQKGGNNNETENIVSSNEENMEHIKQVILKELDNLKEAELVGGECGCDNDRKQRGAGSLNSSSSSSSNSSSSNTSSTGSSTTFEQLKLNDKTNKLAKSVSGSNDSYTNSYTNSNENIKPKIEKTMERSKSKTPKTSSKKVKKVSTSKGNKSKTNKSSKGKKSKVVESQSGGSFSFSNDNKSEEGLSIFPFNSSDIKSSSSIPNQRILRRKI